MATLNNARATGWQGLWTYEAGAPVYSPIQDKIPRRNGIRRLMNRSQWRAASELFDSLIGAASGGTAAKTHTQIQAIVNAPGPIGGGVRTIETVEDINRATTADDITMLKEMTVNVKSRPSYPKDLSGNGGPAFS